MSKFGTKGAKVLPESQSNFIKGPKACICEIKEFYFMVSSGKGTPGFGLLLEEVVTDDSFVATEVKLRKKYSPAGEEQTIPVTGPICIHDFWLGSHGTDFSKPESTVQKFMRMAEYLGLSEELDKNTEAADTEEELVAAYAKTFKGKRAAFVFKSELNSWDDDNGDRQHMLKTVLPPFGSWVRPVSELEELQGYLQQNWDKFNEELPKVEEKAATQQNNAGGIDW